MRYWVGVTDKAWHEFLSLIAPEEVNFWQPGGGRTIRAIDTGAPFLFKLKSPLNYIAGGGFYVRHSILPMSLAWEAFKEKNGAPDFETFRRLINNLRARGKEIEPDPHIGCIVLASPFFLKRSEWIPIPESWSPNIVQGKTYDTKDSLGLDLWNKVQERLNLATIMLTLDLAGASLSAEKTRRYSEEFLTRARLGQGAFRVLVTEAYNRRCAITGERTLPVLESSHIKPFSQSGPNKVNNGILLRSDLHTLFDIGYLTITESLKVEVSKRIKEEYENGREYYAFHGAKLKSIPFQSNDRPSRDFLDWHNHKVFVA